ncbi:hypothetical protein JKP88DRAFT_173803, partial [Tribonema minus]
LYTFGTPRPGDAAFGELFNQSVGTAYRVVHNRDIVPHLAPCCHEAIWGGGCGTGQASGQVHGVLCGSQFPTVLLKHA